MSRTSLKPLPLIACLRPIVSVRRTLVFLLLCNAQRQPLRRDTRYPMADVERCHRRLSGRQGNWSLLVAARSLSREKAFARKWILTGEDHYANRAPSQATPSQYDHCPGMYRTQVLWVQPRARAGVLPRIRSPARHEVRCVFEHPGSGKGYGIFSTDNGVGFPANPFLKR